MKMYKPIIFILIIISLLFVLTSCGGLKDSDQITAKNLITNESLSIKVDVKRSPYLGNWTHFAVEKDIFSFSKEIENKTNSADVFGNEYIIIKSENNFPFLIKEIDKIESDENGDYRYAFFAPTARFKDEIDIFFPYHLMDDISIQYYPGYNNIIFDETQKFKTNYDIKEILNFYDGIDKYSTEWISKNKIKISDDYTDNTFVVTYDSDLKTVMFSFNEKS